MKNPYEVLGVDKNADEKTIKSAFRKLALEKHPDRNKDPKAEEEFKEISAAYNLLSDPKKKQQYDQYGDNPQPDLNGFNGFHGFSGFPGGMGGFGIDIDDFINGAQKRNKQSVFKGEDLHKSLKLDFMEAINGCKKNIKLTYTFECRACGGNGSKNGDSIETCKKCQGSGKTGYMNGFMRIMTTCPECRGTGGKVIEHCITCKGSGQESKEETVLVTIPEGIDENTTARLAGKGSPGINGGPPGDLYVSISIKPHPIFKRNGSTIRTQETIDYLDALLGTKKKVETIHGTKTLTIPPSTQPGAILKMGGLGVKSGDHLVTISVHIPEKLTELEKQLLEQIKEEKINKESK